MRLVAVMSAGESFIVATPARSPRQTALTKKCKISEEDLIKYNGENPNFCDSLTPGQHECCGPGDLPDYSPQPNEDGSCKSYTIGNDESCAAIAAANKISEWEVLEEYSKQPGARRAATPSNRA